MEKNVTVTLETGMVVLTPYAMARMSRHMFGAGRDYTTDERAPLIKYYLYCASIELCLKAAILAEDCTQKQKDFLRDKIGHNLEKAINKCSKSHDLSFLDKDDWNAIRQINPFFKGKGLEYFTVEMMGAALNGYKALPSIGELEIAAAKVQKFLEANKHFRDGKTSQPPSGGLLNFV